MTDTFKSIIAELVGKLNGGGYLIDERRDFRVRIGAYKHAQKMVEDAIEKCRKTDPLTIGFGHEVIIIKELKRELGVGEK